MSNKSVDDGGQVSQKTTTASASKTPATSETDESLSAQSDEYQKAYNRTLDILFKQCLISNKDNPVERYDLEHLWWRLFSKEGIEALDVADFSFLTARGLNTALYLSIFKMDKSSRSFVVDSMKDADRGFLAVLFKLEGSALDGSDNSHSPLDDEDEGNEPQSDETPYEYEESFTPKTIPDDYDNGLSKVSSKTREEPQDTTASTATSDDVAIQATDENLELVTAAYKRTLKICHTTNICKSIENFETTSYKSMQTLFDNLFTLESFVLLDNEDQLFLMDLKPHLNKYLSILSMTDEIQKQQTLEALPANEQGFLRYLHFLKHYEA